MELTELDGFDAATVLRVKSRLRRQMRKTKYSVGLKKFQLEWLLSYIDLLESTIVELGKAMPKGKRDEAD